jgi:hypothetical protein
MRSNLLTGAKNNSKSHQNLMIYQLPLRPILRKSERMKIYVPWAIAGNLR